MLVSLGCEWEAAFWAMCSNASSVQGRVSPWARTMAIPALLDFFPIAFNFLSAGSVFSLAALPQSSSCAQEPPGKPMSCPAPALLAQWQGPLFDVTLLPSSFPAGQRLKHRKPNKAVPKSVICGVSLKAAWHSGQLGGGGCFGALERVDFS